MRNVPPSFVLWQPWVLSHAAHPLHSRNREVGSSLSFLSANIVVPTPTCEAASSPPLCETQMRALSYSQHLPFLARTSWNLPNHMPSSSFPVYFWNCLGMAFRHPRGPALLSQRLLLETIRFFFFLKPLVFNPRSYEQAWEAVQSRPLPAQRPGRHPRASVLSTACTCCVPVDITLEQERECQIGPWVS